MYIIYFKVIDMKNLMLITLFSLLLITQSCNKSTDPHDMKENITIDNIGYIHNYLLDAYSSSLSKKPIKVKSKSTDCKTFGEVYRDLENILLESNRYRMDSNIKDSRLDEISLLKDFESLKLDNTFKTEIKKRFILHINSLNNINNNIRLALLNTLKSSDESIKYNLIKTSNILRDKKGIELCTIYNNVYKASSKHWGLTTENRTLSTPAISIPCGKGASNKELIWADAAGAILGTCCGGVMGVLMGAAFSHAMDTAADNK